MSERRFHFTLLVNCDLGLENPTLGDAENTASELVRLVAGELGIEEEEVTIEIEEGP